MFRVQGNQTPKSGLHGSEGHEAFREAALAIHPLKGPVRLEFFKVHGAY